MNKITKFSLGVVLLVGGMVRAAAAEPLPIAFGETYQVESEILEENRTFNVYLPPEYTEEGTDRFPVIYLLDGALDEDYYHVAGLMRFLATYELMPPAIVVGIANEDRRGDFTRPTRVADDQEAVPTAGGAANFVRFLAEEVQPFAEKNFRTSTRTLIGQSLGGLMAIEVFLARPELFDHYVVVSPSLWWDQSSATEDFEKSIGSVTASATLYLALGEEGEEMAAEMDRVREALRLRAPDSITWHYEPFPAETHATILNRAIYAAMEWQYAQTHPGL